MVHLNRKDGPTFCHLFRNVKRWKSWARSVRYVEQMPTFLSNSQKETTQPYKLAEPICTCLCVESALTTRPNSRTNKPKMTFRFCCLKAKVQIIMIAKKEQVTTVLTCAGLLWLSKRAAPPFKKKEIYKINHHRQLKQNQICNPANRWKSRTKAVQSLKISRKTTSN